MWLVFCGAWFYVRLQLLPNKLILLQKFFVPVTNFELVWYRFIARSRAARDANCSDLFQTRWRHCCLAETTHS